MDFLNYLILILVYICQHAGKSQQQQTQIIIETPIDVIAGRESYISCRILNIPNEQYVVEIFRDDRRISNDCNVNVPLAYKIQEGCNATIEKFFNVTILNPSCTDETTWSCRCFPDEAYTNYTDVDINFIPELDDITINIPEDLKTGRNVASCEVGCHKPNTSIQLFKDGSSLPLNDIVYRDTCECDQNEVSAEFIWDESQDDDNQHAFCCVVDGNPDKLSQCQSIYFAEGTTLKVVLPLLLIFFIIVGTLIFYCCCRKTFSVSKGSFIFPSATMKTGSNSKTSKNQTEDENGKSNLLTYVKAWEDLNFTLKGATEKYANNYFAIFNYRGGLTFDSGPKEGNKLISIYFNNNKLWGEKLNSVKESNIGFTFIYNDNSASNEIVHCEISLLIDYPSRQMILKSFKQTETISFECRNIFENTENLVFHKKEYGSCSVELSESNMTFSFWKQIYACGCLPLSSGYLMAVITPNMEILTLNQNGDSYPIEENEWKDGSATWTGYCCVGKICENNHLLQEVHVKGNHFIVNGYVKGNCNIKNVEVVLSVDETTIFAIRSKAKDNGNGWLLALPSFEGFLKNADFSCLWNRLRQNNPVYEKAAASDVVLIYEYKMSFWESTEMNLRKRIRMPENINSPPSIKMKSEKL